MSVSGFSTWRTMTTSKQTSPPNFTAAISALFSAF
jgi:hypothetical protein